MILIDTSVWIDHLRGHDPHLAALLTARRVLAHPMVTAEIALGSLKARGEVLGLLDGLPQAKVAAVDELRFLIEARGLHSRGIGYVDLALIASCHLMPGVSLWTRDKRFSNIAEDMGIAYQPQHPGPSH